MPDSHRTAEEKIEFGRRDAAFLTSGILSLVNERTAVARKQIGAGKAELGLPVYDLTQETTGRASIDASDFSELSEQDIDDVMGVLATIARRAQDADRELSTLPIGLAHDC